MVAPRRVIALPSDARQRQRLLEISRSRTEPTGRVERARIILAYLDDPSAYAVARAIGVTQQTVTRCLERAAELGVIEALDDRPRAGRDPVITPEAKTWLVEQTNAGKAFRAIRKDPLLAQRHRPRESQPPSRTPCSQQGLAISRAARATELKLLQ